MKGTSWFFLNGNFLSTKEFSLPQPGSYIDGIFTSIRVNHGRVELLEAHFERLKHAAGKLNYDNPIINPSWIDQLIDLNEAFDGVWKLKIILFKEFSHSPTIDSKHLCQACLITLMPYTPIFKRACHLMSSLQSLECVEANIKTTLRTPYTLMHHAAAKKGFDDALITTHEGIVLEATHANIFWTSDGACEFPSFDLPLIKGVFFSFFQKHLKMPMKGVKKTLKEIPQNASIYLCNSLMHICPVEQIDGLLFPRHLDQEHDWANHCQKILNNSPYAKA